MFAALAVLRVIVLLNAVGLYAYRCRAFDHPGLGWLVMAVLTIWTGCVTWACARERTRRPWVFGIDLGLAIAAIAISPLVKGENMRATLPGFWISGVLLAWAIRYRSKGGLAAAGALSVADLLVRNHLSQTTYANIFLMLLGGQVVGFLSARMQQLAAERDAAVLVSVSAAERQRLARVVHDGVLQVLALVQRNGSELGSTGRELAAMAGAEEARLRAFVQSDAAAAVVTGTVDLSSRLADLGTAEVSVSVPAQAVLVPAHTAEELVAVVEACLSNVRHHVGRDAPVWILLEDLGASLAISVRDQGPGIADGRLEEAAAGGRLGVQQSIRGRIADLGGTAQLGTSPAGTEWEFSVPKERA